MPTNEIKIRKRLCFAAIPDVIFTARHLSTDARLTLAWALGRPDAWTFSVHHIQTELGLSRHRWRRIRDELATDGWLCQSRTHDGITHTTDGREIHNAVRWHTEITDEPLIRLLAGADTEPQDGGPSSSDGAAEPTPTGVASKCDATAVVDATASQSPSSKNSTMEVPSFSFSTVEKLDDDNKEEEEGDFSPPISPPHEMADNAGVVSPPSESPHCAETERTAGRAEGKDLGEANAAIPPGELVDSLHRLGFRYHSVVARGFVRVVRRWQDQGLTRAEWQRATALAHDQLPEGELPRSPNYYRWAVEQVMAERGCERRQSAPRGGNQDTRRGQSSKHMHRRATTAGYSNAARRSSHHGLSNKDYRAGAATDEEIDAWLAARS